MLYIDVFSEKEAAELSEHIKHDYIIDIMPGKDLLYWLIYWLNPKKQEVL